MAKRAFIKSFAKVNLYLDVICKRPDGYHNIETIFQTVSLADSIEIELTPSVIRIYSDHPLVPADENNLAFKAFVVFKKAVGYHGGVRISLRKRVPPGSGLGGGSSNAAALIVGLNHLLRAGLTEEHMRRIGARIGADVPFFISGGLAAAWRLGDKLKLLVPESRSYIVVAIPRGVAVSTVAAYKMVSAPKCNGTAPRSLSQCSDKLKTFVSALGLRKSLSENEGVISLLRNSLEGPIFARHPEIERVKNSLLKAGARGALMTGSGSAVFGLASSLAHARKIKKTVEKSRVCDCFVTRTTNSGSVLSENIKIIKNVHFIARPR
ncbi:MAG: 4-(cytidine 5'-diphospho)-2-C-methyl-D-erythritol kinase [Candidatus Lindowbacteria bacterium]|nr:4-(cytidine 5'-diphospho)-2-C-methyl-D-erythritol kinase [Candidatus Lindowbacteria bacterium]